MRERLCPQTLTSVVAIGFICFDWTSGSCLGRQFDLASLRGTPAAIRCGALGTLLNSRHSCYTSVIRYMCMGTKLMAVRVETELWDAAVRRAELLGTSVSEIVREALREAVDPSPLGERIGRLRGSMQTELAKATEDRWQSEIRAHNWRS